MLIQANLPLHFWVDAVYTATYIINRLPTPLLQGLSPFEKLFSKPPDYTLLRVFGCECFPNFPAKSSNKLSPRSVRCVFLGYAPHYKGYRCLDSKTGRVYVSRYVVFHESIFPYTYFVGSPIPSNQDPKHFPHFWSPTPFPH